MTRTAKSQRTQWSTTFLVAAELTRRGYTVAMTNGGHTPIADLMVGTDDGRQFWVDVKGLSSRAPWLLKPQRERLNLFYVLVYLASEPAVGDVREPDRYFVLRQNEANELVAKFLDAHKGDTG